MFDFKVNKVNNIQMLDINTMEPVADFSGIGNVTIESEIDTSSLSKEVLSLNHETSFECELTDCSLLFSYTTNFNDKPLYVEYYIPIMIQARWHKKPRINKKWLKRYGMKKDTLLVRCNVESFTPNTYNPYSTGDHIECGITLSGMDYKFRPDQLRRNLKLEVY